MIAWCERVAALNCTSKQSMSESVCLSYLPACLPACQINCSPPPRSRCLTSIAMIRRSLFVMFVHK